MVVTQEVDVGTPVSRKLRKQNGTPENELSTPETKKTKHHNKTSPKNDTTTNIKRNTVRGDEYQRILQILIRHRGFRLEPDIKIGSEVSGVDALDDIAYYTKKTCRFFQVKHSKKPVSISHIFQTDFSPKKLKKSPQNDVIGTASKKESKKSNKCELHLVLYFKGFLKIKKNIRFKGLDIEELTLVTNKRLTGLNDKQEFMNLLEEVDLKDDKFLNFEEDEFLDREDDDFSNLEESRTVKYSLNVTEVRPLFQTGLEKEYTKHLEENNRTFDQNEFEKLVEEFLTKIRIIINYPDIKHVWKIVMSEIFCEDFHCEQTRKTLLHCLVHMEIELLTQDNQYLTFQEWKTNIEKVKSLIDKVKMTGITDYESKRLLWKLELGDLVFDNESINDMITDLETFLGSKVFSVLHINQVKNVELYAVQVMNFLKYKKPLSVEFFLCPLKGLLVTNAYLDNVFLDSKLIVLYNSDEVACKKDNCEFKEIAEKIVKSYKDSTKKYIFISQNEHFFCSCPEISNTPNYCSKQYRHGFKALSEACKVEILNKEVIFQGKTMSFGSIFQNSLTFAEDIIDEDNLWELMNPRLPYYTVSNMEALSSPGYDKHYYIPRKFYQFDDKHESQSSEDMMETLKKSEKEMLTMSGSDKPIIVVGDSGEGKSTVLTHIANLLKEEIESIWIVRVNLRQFFDKNKLSSFGNVADCESSLKMALKMAFPNGHGNFEKILFEKGLKEKMLKLAIFLDGFNEIGTTTQSRLCNFVKSMHTNLNIHQCWITSQKQDKKKLEDKFVAAHYLISLSDKDQINLLVKYWSAEYTKRSPLEQHSDSELRADAIAALASWKQHISDENEKPFTSISLNLKMLADILLEKDRKLDQNLSFFNLYETFVNYKFSCYTRETSVCSNCKDDQALDEAKEKLFAYSIRKILQQISAERILWEYIKKESDKKKIPGLKALEKYKKRVGEENQKHEITLSKIGLLTIKNGDFELSHHSYAQFFFSEYLMRFLDDTNVQLFLMKHVLREDSLMLCRRFVENQFMRHYVIQSPVEIPHYRNVVSALSDTTLKVKAQVIFMQKCQSSVVMEENLLYTMRFLSTKLNETNCKTFLRRAIVYSVESFTDDEFISNTLESIEAYIKRLSKSGLSKLLKEPALFGQRVKFYSEAETRVTTLLEVLSKIK